MLWDLLFEGAEIAVVAQSLCFSAALAFVAPVPSVSAVVLVTGGALDVAAAVAVVQDASPAAWPSHLSRCRCLQKNPPV